jgi:hypothetical protein
VPVAQLSIVNSANVASTTPGSVVRFTATFTNTGQTFYDNITVAADVTDVLDDAIPNGDQTASSGTLEVTSTGLRWTGSIPVGGTVTVTGTVTVKSPDPGNKVLTASWSSSMRVQSSCWPARSGSLSGCTVPAARSRCLRAREPRCDGRFPPGAGSTGRGGSPRPGGPAVSAMAGPVGAARSEAGVNPASLAALAVLPSKSLRQARQLPQKGLAALSSGQNWLMRSWIEHRHSGQWPRAVVGRPGGDPPSSPCLGGLGRLHDAVSVCRSLLLATRGAIYLKALKEYQWH